MHDRYQSDVAVSDRTVAGPSVLPLAIEWHSMDGTDANVRGRSSPVLGSHGQHEIAQSTSDVSHGSPRSFAPDDTTSTEDEQLGDSEPIDLESPVRFIKYPQSFSSTQSDVTRASVLASDRGSTRDRSESHSPHRGRYQWVESDEDSIEDSPMTKPLQTSAHGTSCAESHTTRDAVLSSDNRSERSHASHNPPDHEEHDKRVDVEHHQAETKQDSGGINGPGTRLDMPVLEQDAGARAEASPPQFTKKRSSHQKLPEHFDQEQEAEPQTGPKKPESSGGKLPQESAIAKPLADPSDEVRRTKEELEHLSTAKKEQEEKIFQQRYELEFRKRLGHFGFRTNQIDALLNADYVENQTENKNPPGPFNAPTMAQPPTYIKIHKDHLDVETLHYYDIPYEWDEDGNHIIVLREMSDRETEVLFEHTRRLRNSDSQPKHNPIAVSAMVANISAPVASLR